MIVISGSAEEMSRAAAGRFAALACEAVRARDRFVVALAGGDTPRRAYELLSEEPLRSRVEWERVHLFWGDERCVLPEDERSNERMARRALIDKVPVPPENVRPIRCSASAERAAGRYELLLREFFGGAEPRFDLVMLGLGEDGHTASLFPNSAALGERNRWVVGTVCGGEDFARVTMTAALINMARKVIFLVSGSNKARVLKRVVEGGREPRRFPAQLVRPSGGEPLWIVDRAAGALLSGTHHSVAAGDKEPLGGEGGHAPCGTMERRER